MKKHRFSVGASCVITIKKVSGSMVHTVYSRFHPRFRPLSIYYIFNVYNDAVTQRPVCRAPWRVILRVIFQTLEFRRTRHNLRRAILDALVFIRVRLWLIPIASCLVPTPQTSNFQLQTGIPYAMS
jgi:hypothetical protein